MFGISWDDIRWSEGIAFGVTLWVFLSIPFLTRYVMGKRDRKRRIGGERRKRYASLKE